MGDANSLSSSRALFHTIWVSIQWNAIRFRITGIVPVTREIGARHLNPLSHSGSDQRFHLDDCSVYFTRRPARASCPTSRLGLALRWSCARDRGVFNTSSPSPNDLQARRTLERFVPVRANVVSQAPVYTSN